MLIYIFNFGSVGLVGRIQRILFKIQCQLKNYLKAFLPIHISTNWRLIIPFTIKYEILIKLKAKKFNKSINEMHALTIIQIYSYFACILLFTSFEKKIISSTETVACRDFISFRKRFKGGKFWNKQWTTFFKETHIVHTPLKAL